MRNHKKVARNRGLHLKLTGLALTLSLVLVACGGGTETTPSGNEGASTPVEDLTNDLNSSPESADGTDDSQQPDLAEGTSTPAEGEKPPTDSSDIGQMLVAYSYEEYDALEYDLNITQDVTVDLQGSHQVSDLPDAMASDGSDSEAEEENDAFASEDPPQVIDDGVRQVAHRYDLTNTLEGSMRYQPGVKNEEGLLPVRVTAEFEKGTTEGNADGIPFYEDLSEELGIGIIHPVDVTVWVDEQGNIQDTDTGQEDLDPFAGMVLEQFSTVAGISQQHYERPFGPAFPDYPIDAGDSWSETLVVDGPSGEIVTEVDHTLLEVQEGSSDVLVGQSVYLTEAYTIDFSDIFRSLFSAFADDENADDATDDLALAIDIGQSTVTVDWHYDSASGLVEHGTQRVQTSIASNFDLDPTDTDTVQLSAEIDQTTEFARSLSSS